MNKLLRANFHRLWRNKVFWFAMCTMLAFSIYAVIGTLKDNEGAFYSNHAVTSPDILLCSGTSIIGIVAAIYIAFYLGTEYGDGTIRNKLIVGHTRRRIYLSNLTVCAVAALMMNAVYMFGVTVGGIAAIGAYKLGFTVLLKAVCVQLIETIAISAFFLMIAMSIQNKSITVASLILVAFLITGYQGIVYDRLMTPEYYEAYTWQDEKGNTYEQPREKNPTYPTGVKRKYYEFMYDFLPGCQIMQMNGMLSDCIEERTDLTGKENKKLILFTGYSLLILFVSSGCGMLLFRKKDIR